MGLLDDVTATQAAAKRGGVCTVSVWIDSLTAEQRADALAALAPDSGYEATVIHAVIKAKYGFERGVSTVQRHRRGECDCGTR